MNLRLDFGGTSVLILHYKKQMLQSYFLKGVTLTSVTVSLRKFAHGPTEMDAWSYGKG